MEPLKLIIPENFLNEEERCGVIIPQSLKKIWAVQLDLMAEFDRVCKKHNIKYYAFGGTLLGAIRHKGYIPWDDDIDLALFRPDYEKLITVAESEFLDPYLFQHSHKPFKDNPFVVDMVRLRNNNTTAIEKFQLQYSPNVSHGIFIDIIPLDNAADDAKALKKQLRNIKKYHWIFRQLAFSSTDHFIPHPNKLITLTRRVLCKICGKLLSQMAALYFERYVSECRKYNGKETKRAGQLALIIDNPEKLIFERKDFMDSKDYPFEFMTVPVGKGAESMLEHQYGNWKKMVRGTQYHIMGTIDADRPYQDVIKTINIK